MGTSENYRLLALLLRNLILGDRKAWEDIAPNREPGRKGGVGDEIRAVGHHIQRQLGQSAIGLLSSGGGQVDQGEVERPNGSQLHTESSLHVAIGIGQAQQTLHPVGRVLSGVITNGKVRVTSAGRHALTWRHRPLRLMHTELRGGILTRSRGRYRHGLFDRHAAACSVGDPSQGRQVRVLYAFELWHRHLHCENGRAAVVGAACPR
jgi:hypothetical protein